MLTKQDLKQIKQIVRDEVTSEAETTKLDLRAEVKYARAEIGNKINVLAGRVKNLEQQTNKNFKKIDKKFIELIDHLDEGHMKLVKRVNRIEEHLNIRPVADF